MADKLLPPPYTEVAIQTKRVLMLKITPLPHLATDTSLSLQILGFLHNENEGFMSLLPFSFT